MRGVQAWSLMFMHRHDREVTGLTSRPFRTDLLQGFGKSRLQCGE